MPLNEAIPLLEASNLRCEREERVLFEGLDLAIAGGEVLQIGGANGSGKTTLLRALAGLSALVSGNLRWCGAELRTVRWEFLRDSLFIGHEPAVKPGLSARENLRWHAALWQRTRERDIDSSLAEFGLGAFLDTPAQHLSAGQRRRIALARLLLSPARLWILDEPFTAIDHEGVRQIEALLGAHAANGGAVLLSTHHPLALDCALRRIELGAQAA